MRSIDLASALFGPLAALSLTVTPAAAQAASENDKAATREADAADGIAETLRNPQIQATAAATVAILGEVMLDMPIGPLVQALDEVIDRAAANTGTQAPERSDIASDATVRDLAGPAGDRLAVELAERVPQAMDAAAGMSSAAQRMVPVLQEAAGRIRRSLPTRLPTLQRD